MGLMDRLLGRKENEVKQAPASTNKSANMNFQTLQRRDGSKIDIMPVVDKMGNQTGFFRVSIAKRRGKPYFKYQIRNLIHSKVC